MIFGEGWILTKVETKGVRHSRGGYLGFCLSAIISFGAS